MNGLAVPVLAGNWKLHKGPLATRQFFVDFSHRVVPSEDRTVLFFPPAISLAAAVDAVRDRPDLLLGVQNVHWESHGAYTGEISAEMAAETGARAALVGHSERRHVFGESDEETGRKVAAVGAAGLLPILCVGETLEERRAGRLEDVIERQFRAGLAALPELPAEGLVLAYEPVWAIGTGVNATPEDASAAHRVLRRLLRERYGGGAAAVPILYGGSVKPDNARELLDADEVGGLLVGGASLSPESFAAIVAAAAGRTSSQ
jgi:triosephosphate isomerase (TIM)